MRKISYVIPSEYEGRKVQQYLRDEAGYSTALLKSLKQYADGLLLNGRHIRTIDPLHTGDLLEITIRDTPKPAAASGSAPILYEDEDVIVFNKPAGMPCHQSRNHQDGTLANAFAALCAARSEPLTFRAVIRLDRNTTGAVVVAKNAYAASRLAGKVDKEYLAVTSVPPNPSNGTVDAPIGRPDPYNIRRAVMPEGQRAVTVYRTLAVTGGHALVSCALPTGRTHQIRVHMAYLGCPLLGDDLYGGQQDEFQRQALHCARVRFLSPAFPEPVEVYAPLPQDMQKYADKSRNV